VLYRYGIAILDHFYRFNHANAHVSLGLTCVSDFCSHIPVGNDKLAKTAFGYRNMSRKNIESLFHEEERAMKKARAQASSKGMANKLPDYRTRLLSVIEPFLVKNSQIEADSSSSSSSAVEPRSSGRSSWATRLKGLRFSPSKKWYLNASSHSSSQHSFYHHHHPQSNINLPAFSVENTGSCILVAEQIAQLWRWLPTRYQILELQLIYSTNIHGCRLMTLMDKIEYYSATIIVIQTTNNSIFGTYCSQPWSNRISPDRLRKVMFFGSGETFLFELAPNIHKYEWIGKRTEQGGETHPGQELFQFANHEKLIVGGASSTNKGIGLLVNSDLTYGRTDVSDTFENQILGGQKDFEIAILEVFSFNSS
jgi:hypothetical protein